MLVVGNEKNVDGGNVFLEVKKKLSSLCDGDAIFNLRILNGGVKKDVEVPIHRGSRL